MKSWIISIVFSAILTGIFCLILPKGNVSPLIKGIFSVLLLIVVLKPVLTVKDDDFNFESFYGDEISLDKDYLSYFNAKRNDINIRKCKEILNEKGFLNCDISIEFFADEDVGYVIKKVDVKLNKSGIFSKEENISIIEEIKHSISLAFGIGVDLINVYE